MTGICVVLGSGLHGFIPILQEHITKNDVVGGSAREIAGGLLDFIRDPDWSVKHPAGRVRFIGGVPEMLWAGAIACYSKWRCVLVEEDASGSVRVSALREVHLRHLLRRYEQEPVEAVTS